MRQKHSHGEPSGVSSTYCLVCLTVGLIFVLNELLFTVYVQEMLFLPLVEVVQFVLGVQLI